MKSMALPGPI